MNYSAFKASNMGFAGFVQLGPYFIIGNRTVAGLKNKLFYSIMGIKGINDVTTAAYAGWSSSLTGTIIEQCLVRWGLDGKKLHAQSYKVL